jgi:hypothetical protein
LVCAAYAALQKKNNEVANLMEHALLGNINEFTKYLLRCTLQGVPDALMGMAITIQSSS